MNPLSRRLGSGESLVSPHPIPRDGNVRKRTQLTRAARLPRWRDDRPAGTASNAKSVNDLREPRDEPGPPRLYVSHMSNVRLLEVGSRREQRVASSGGGEARVDDPPERL